MTNRAFFNEKYRTVLAQLGKTEVPDISQADLNTITKTGSYSGINCTNTPNNDKRFIKLIVTKHTSDWIVQEVLTADDEIYLRALQGGIWYDWQELDVNNNNGTSQGPGVTIEVLEKPYNHPLATEQSNGYMSKDDKYKLDRIENRANYYLHPETHPAYMITEETDKQFVSEADKNNWNSKAAGNHVHQDLLNRIETIEGTLNSIPTTIEMMQNKITELEQKILEMEQNAGLTATKQMIAKVNDLDAKVATHIEPDLNS